MKVALNRDFGGFSLSETAMEGLRQLGVSAADIQRMRIGDQAELRRTRTDPHLIQVVEELGVAVNGECATIQIVEIADDLDERWTISEYDGYETVHEFHRSW